MRRALTLSLLPALFLGCPHPDQKPAKTTAPAAVGAAELTSTLTSSVKGASVEVRTGGSWAALTVGVAIPAGAQLRTPAGLQAKLTLKSGTVVHLNESSELLVVGERKVKLIAGELLAEVSPAPAGGTAAEIDTAQSAIRVTGTKLNVKADKEATVVDVTRGTVEVAGRTDGTRIEVGAGERALVKAGAAPKVSISQDLAEVTRWSRELGPLPGQPESLHPGIGSLEARVPVAPGVRATSYALNLARQEVRVLVHDNVARTEVEQEWHNSSGQTLEGTYRFPLPAGASISRLALYIGSHVEEGEIVERQRARQIFRQIVDDTVRPRDPALLEWVGGRTFQMRIFPIPAHGSRKVILGYTQTLPASYGRTRYEYPMASEPGKATTVGRMVIDLRATSGRGLPAVQTPLYPMTTEKDNESVHLRYEQTDFRPAASFVATMLPGAQPPELQLALYEPEPSKAQPACAVEAAPADGQGLPPSAAAVLSVGRGVSRRRPALAACGDRGGFFMAVLRPELPTEGRAKPRDYLFILDSSHSSGKRGWGLQLAALETFLAEMDLRSRFDLMVCDATCRTGGSFEKPGAAARQAALKLARSIKPGGASNLQAAFDEAGQALSRASIKGAQVIYFGDGRPSAGELREPELARRVVAALRPSGARLSAIQIGDDVSELFLPEATRRLAGAVHRLSPGDDVARLVLDVVAAQYRPTLTDLELSFEGLDVHHIYPAQLPSLTAGSEAVLTGRYGKGGKGALLVRGQLDGKPFERRFPLSLAAEKDERKANRFMPRVWAQHHLEALTVEDYGRNRNEIVRVSKAYTVLSRATAFLVLENERMYKEFGVSRTKHTNDFKAGAKVAVRDGKDQAQATPDTAKAEAAPATGTSGLASKGGGGAAGPAPAAAQPAGGAPAEESERKRASTVDDLDAGDAAGADKAKEKSPAPEPKAKADRAEPSMPAPAKMSKKAPMARPRRAMEDEAIGSSGMARMGRGYRMPPRPQTVVTMRSSPSAPTQAALRQEDSLRQQVAAAPLRRGVHASYHRVLMRNGSLDEALRHAGEWAELDGSHADALAALADVQALQADLATSLRTRSSTVDVEPGNARWHQQLADMYRNKGQLKQSCAHLWSLVSLAPKNAERYVALVRCLGGLPDGRESALSLLTDDAPAGLARAQSGKLLGLLRELRAGEAPKAAVVSTTGPMVLSATWDTPKDLDIVLYTPGGERISALSRGRAGGTAVDSRDGRMAEILRLGSLRNGEYRVEMVRLSDGSAAAKGSSSVRGTLRVQAGGKTATFPFTLTSSIGSVAQVQVAQLYPSYRYR
jgi:hypothetical protein